jgi:hypothetical protein
MSEFRHSLLLPASTLALLFSAAALAETPSAKTVGTPFQSLAESKSKEQGTQSKQDPAAAAAAALPARDAAQFAPGARAGKDANSALTDALAGSAASKARSEAAAGLGAGQTKAPGFNQGYSAPPVLSPGSFDKGNAVQRLTGGSVAGVVGAAAAGDSGSTGVAGQGKGAISDGFMGSMTRNGADQVRAVSKQFTSSNGETIKVYEDGGFDITGTNGKTESYDKNNQCTAGCVKRPSGEQRMTPAEMQAFLKAHPALAAQLQQARSGQAGGDIDPGRGDSTAFTSASAPLPISSSQRQMNLVGQPGQAAAGQRVQGPGSGPDFNNPQNGAVDPGPEATVTAGGQSENPADFFGRQPGPSGGLQAPTSSSDQDEDQDQSDEKSDKKGS